MAQTRPAASGGLCLALGAACLVVAAAAAALPELCPPPADAGAGAADELTPLCQTVRLERSGGLLTPVTCPTEGCRCHRQRPELRCVPFNTTVTQQRDGTETKTSVTVACVCAIPG
ncbi:hypothetical protein FJT64_015036 [Amphibalanus amphitrite]|uniref:Uncharacterized protein n=1 Tax=Amphibalanus amphitrite TaxID=1232801 RepID=A0A6A4XES0_AMPAM|nr:hypothetical protein FJT64_015036 [Amphibalanus amphitrite]